MRIGYLDCFSGISGDMLLGVMVDAGVPLEYLSEVATSLQVGARLEARKVSRGGVAGTKVDVLTGADKSQLAHEHPPYATDLNVHTHQHTHVDEHGHTHTHSHPHTHAAEHSHDHDQGHAHPHPHEHSHEHVAEHAHTHEHDRSLTVILEIIRNAKLTDAVKDQATRAFRMLGEAEAAIHSIPVETVHFHEVGAVDTIVDIVCAAAGAAYLGVDRWYASALNVGSGTVECAHGTLPVPAPATLKLLADAPIYASGAAMERVTPTGATILRMLNVTYAPLPALRTSASGYGAGGRDTPGQPNLLRLLVGESDSDADATEPIAILETVIDDSTPQVIAYVSELLLQSGAWDVYRIPVQMKKGRTGFQLTVLCSPDQLTALRDLLFRETTTIGAHWRIESKIGLQREFADVATQWGNVRMKIARASNGQVVNASPEYEDCRSLASLHKVPLKRVLQEAARVYAETKETDGTRAD